MSPKHFTALGWTAFSENSTGKLKKFVKERNVKPLKIFIRHHFNLGKKADGFSELCTDSIKGNLKVCLNWKVAPQKLCLILMSVQSIMNCRS